MDFRDQLFKKNIIFFTLKMRVVVGSPFLPISEFQLESVGHDFFPPGISLGGWLIGYLKSTLNSLHFRINHRRVNRLMKCETSYVDVGIFHFR
jgi:hypothetical protein